MSTTSVFPGDLNTFDDPPSNPGAVALGASSPTHAEHHQKTVNALRTLEAAVGKTGSTDPASIEKRLVDVIDAAAAAAADVITAMAAAAQVASDLATLDSSLGTAATTDATDYATAAQGSAADAHAAASAPHSGHSTPASLAAAISAHEGAGDPHTGYALESALGTAATLNVGTGALNIVQLDGTGKLPAVDGSQLLNLPGGGGGVTDHGALTGLADDDHTQYHNDARGDARYALIAKGVTNGDAHDHNGGDGAQIAYSTLSGLPTLGSAAAAATGDFEAAGAVSTHNAVTTAHGISAFGATLVDDADAATARTTLGLGSAATTASGDYSPAAHTSDTANPHSVTKSQVGLSAVDNTSDANKPVSTAQQTALNLKANIASPTFTGTVGGITAAMVGAPSGSGTSTGTNTGDSATPAETTTTIGSLINGATSKTTPVDADQIGLMDSAASNILKKLSWENIKTALFGISSTLAKLVVRGESTSNNALSALFQNSSGNSLFSVANGGQVIFGDTTTAVPTKLSTSTYTPNIQIVSTGATASFLIGRFSNNSFSAKLSFLKSAGSSIGATDALASGSYLGEFSFAGTNGTEAAEGARISAITTASNAGLTYSPTELRFYSSDGTTIASPSAVITSAGDLVVGGSSASARAHFVKTSEQLRLGYDTANYESSTTSSAGKTTKALVGTSPDIKWSVSDATTNALYDLATFSKNSTGAGAAGLGARINLAAKSSTTTDTLQGALSASWVDATHATRKARTRIWAADSTGLREGVRIEADGTQVLLGFYGGNAVAKPTALTATVAAAPAGGTGTAAGGWDTSGNRDLAIATINNLKTRVDQLETKLQALGLLT